MALWRPADARNLIDVVESGEIDPVVDEPAFASIPSCQVDRQNVYYSIYTAGVDHGKIAAWLAAPALNLHESVMGVYEPPV